MAEKIATFCKNSKRYFCLLFSLPNFAAAKDQLTAIVNENPQVKQHVFYNQLTGQEKEAGILEGYLDINKVPELDLAPDAHYFICGPTAFIQKQYSDLVAAGIDKQRIYFEEFGPQVLAMN